MVQPDPLAGSNPPGDPSFGEPPTAGLRQGEDAELLVGQPTQTGGVEDIVGPPIGCSLHRRKVGIAIIGAIVTVGGHAHSMARLVRWVAQLSTAGPALCPGPDPAAYL